VVDLLHVPVAGGCGDEESAEVEEGEGEDCAPGEGVADATVEGVGLVLVEAEDVGARFGAGEAAAQGGYAGADEDGDEPGEVAASEAVGEEREGQRAGGEEEDPDPDGPVGEAVESSVAFPNFSLPRIFDLAAVLHMGSSFAEGLGAGQSGG
jgi:hypothetical protein